MDEGSLKNNLNATIGKLYSKSNSLKKDLIEIACEEDWEPMSLVMGTYNRGSSLGKLPNCSWGLKEYSPLLFSVLCNVNSGFFSDGENIIGEVVVVDDCSTDDTPQTIDELEKLIDPIPVRYIQAKRRLFVPKAWDLGVKKARHSIIKLQDDDHIDHPCNIFLGNYLLRKLEDKYKLGVVKSPTPLRSTIPTGVVPKDQIGIISNSKIGSRFYCFPGEYLKDTPSDELGVIDPLIIKNLAGILFFRKKIILDVGGFNDDKVIEGSYGAESNLAIKLMKNNYVSFFATDPRMLSIHLKIGYSTNNNNFDVTFAEHFKISKQDLNRIYELSNIPNFNTGDRMRSKLWLYHRIRNFASLKNTMSKRDFMRFALTSLFEVLGSNGFSEYHIDELSFSNRLLVYCLSIKNGVSGQSLSPAEMSLVNS